MDSYVSETERRHAFPSLAQRHILAGLASAVGGLSAPYEKASRVHERPVVDWLWASGCHPFGPFSNTSQISQMLQDVALVSQLSFSQNIENVPDLGKLMHHASRNFFYLIRFNYHALCGNLLFSCQEITFWILLSFTHERSVF